MGVQLVYHNPTTDDPFGQALSKVKKGGRLKIAVPYLSLARLKRLLENTPEWALLTDLSEWLKAESNHQGILKFLEAYQGRILHLEGLHAKVFIGKNHALVSSSNLTTAGLEQNEEMGVLIDERELLEELEQWFDSIWHQTTPIDLDEVREKIKRLAMARVQSPPPVDLSFSFGRRRDLSPQTPIESSVLSLTPADEEGFLRLQAKVRLLQTRGFDPREPLEVFLALAERLIKKLKLERSDPRLSWTVPQKNTVIMAININQRYALALAYDDRDDTGVDILAMVTRDFATRLALEPVYEFKHFPGEAISLALISLNNLMDRVGDLEDAIEIDSIWDGFFEAFFQSAEYELGRQSASSFRKFHQPWLYDIALNENTRTSFLENLVQQ